MGDSIERLAEIQYCYVYLGSRVEGKEKVTHGGQELGFTKKACSEHMV